MSNLDDSSLISFKAVANFTQELSQQFGKNQRPLLLYHRLIKKTTLCHTEPILKHLEAFRTFCVENREAIIDKDIDKITNPEIVYTPEKVFINLESVFELADTGTKNVIWKHLLTISALLDPTSKAKEILKESIKQKQARGESGSEEQFLSNIMDKVEQNVDPNTITNPMAAVSSIMSSGVFTELIGSMNTGLQDGSLDLGKLMQSVQGMVASVGQMNQGEAGDGDAPPMPDMGAMLGNLTGMMGMMGMPPGETSTVEEVDE